MERSVHYKVYQYPARFRSQLQKLRSEGHLVDVTLCAEGTEIPCHRVVLSACTDYFRAMFSGNHIESKKDKVDILGVSAEALQLLVDFAYTSEVTITTSNVQPLYEAVHMMQVKDLEDCCKRFLTENMSFDICLGTWVFADKVSTWVFADKVSWTQLSDKARWYALTHFELVCKTEEFLQLPVEYLKTYISDHDLHAKKEEQVLEVIMLWARHNLEERQGHLKELMECVHFSHLDQNFLKDIMETDEVIAGVPGIKELMRDQSRHPEPRHIQQEEILVLGGVIETWRRSYGNGRINNNMYRLGRHCDCVDTTRTLESIQESAYGSAGIAVCILNDDIIVTGGIYSPWKVWRYRTSLRSWTKLRRLNTGRWSHGMAVLHGQVYAVGGDVYTSDSKKNQSKTHEVPNRSTSEVYSEMTNSWEEIAPLAERVWGLIAFGIATCCDKVYVFGGKSGVNNTGPVTNSLQCYDPTQNVWTYAAPLPRPVMHITACTVNSKIYLVGGLLDHVLCYNPQEDCYETMVARLGPWDRCGATVCGSEIIITGGCNNYDEEDDIPTCAVQYYNVSSNTIWMDEDKLPVPLLEHKVVTLLKH